MSALLLLVAPTLAASLQQRDFARAARDFDVPEPLLLAISWEASRWKPDVASAWGGYGPFDLREEGSPNVETAASLLDVSPDLLIRDPVWNLRGAAALLRAHGDAIGDPDTDDLAAWWDAVVAFSGEDDPVLQHRYTAYIYATLARGEAADGLVLLPRDVDVSDHPVPIPPPGTCDYSGCDAFIEASAYNYSDYSRDASDISYIVIHTVQGSYEGCISWFQNSAASVSAHYVVSTDGDITQMVDESDVAWHAGNWDYNLASVGIEHEGYVEYPETYYTESMYTASAALSRDIVDRNGIPISRSYIIAHSEVPGATHTDPGDGWDWDYYMSLIEGGSSGGSTSTGDLVGAIADSDIYTGARLAGATVWIAETGEVTTSDSDGMYYFYDLGLSSYTVHATLDGYAEGTCSKSISTGTNWCSIALTPGGSSGGGDSGSGGDGGGSEGGGSEGGGGETGDPGGVDTQDPGGSEGGSEGGGDGGGGDEGDLSEPPGALLLVSDTKGGCGCASSPARSGLAALLAGATLALFSRRARAGDRSA